MVTRTTMAALTMMVSGGRHAGSLLPTPCPGPFSDLGLSSLRRVPGVHEGGGVDPNPHPEPPVPPSNSSRALGSGPGTRAPGCELGCVLDRGPSLTASPSPILGNANKTLLPGGPVSGIHSPGGCGCSDDHFLPDPRACALCIPVHHVVPDSLD